jgi:hypothetical protein
MRGIASTSTFNSDFALSIQDLPTDCNNSQIHVVGCITLAENSDAIRWQPTSADSTYVSR